MAPALLLVVQLPVVFVRWKVESEKELLVFFFLSTKSPFLVLSTCVRCVFVFVCESPLAFYLFVIFQSLLV